MPTNLSAVANSFNAPNFIGELFMVGDKKTPFLNMLGGLSGGKQSNAWDFPISQEWNLDAAAQPAIAEAASLTAPTARTYIREQKANVVQIFHKAVAVSYAKSSMAGQLSGLNIEGKNEVRDELAFQLNANLAQVAKDVDYTFINGVYAAPADVDTAAKTRGMLASVVTNTVAAVAAALTTDMIKSLVRTMADNSAPFSQPVLFCNSFQMEKITDLYDGKFMTDSRTVGGMAVKTILTDFCELNIIWAPHMPQDDILIADMAYINPVFLPVPGKGFLFYEALAKSGAAESGQIYGQIGLDHGVEAFHGSITDLAVV
jgi:hypothetical protein